MSERPHISVIIPTVGRESLRHSLRSALEQSLAQDKYEIIVVNDSGSELDIGATLRSDERVRMITTNRRRQCFARNSGAAIARGRYLLFLDDDDRLMPDGLEALMTLVQKADHPVVAYGGFVFVDERDTVLGKINLGVSGNCASQMLAGAWIQFGSACIRSDAFFKVGGLDPALVGGVEVDLFRRLALLGDFANTQANIVNVTRGEGWETSMDYSVVVECMRVSRENMLDKRNAFQRIARSAKSAYWHGRNLKAYGASAYYNIKQKQILRAVSRSIFASRALLVARSRIFKRSFYQALYDTQVPASGHRVLDSK